METIQTVKTGTQTFSLEVPSLVSIESFEPLMAFVVDENGELVRATGRS